jgi:hypothetical protein
LAERRETWWRKTPNAIEAHKKMLAGSRTIWSRGGSRGGGSPSGRGGVG